LVGLVHEPLETAGAIEQRIFGVQMEMDKFGVRHALNLTLTMNRAQGKSTIALESGRNVIHSPAAKMSGGAPASGAPWQDSVESAPHLDPLPAPRGEKRTRTHLSRIPFSLTRTRCHRRS